jgi:hemolysin III
LSSSSTADTSVRAAPDHGPALPAARGASKPTWRGWLHLLWFEASLVVGTALVIESPTDVRAPLAVYAATVCCLFGTSALYHRGAWRPAMQRLMQRLDHAMIFLLIAGTSTPICAIAVHGDLSVILLSGIWTLTGITLILHLIWMQAPEVLVGSTYVGLGCLGAAALPAVWEHAGVAACLLIALGGILYIAGAVLYHLRRPDPWPAVFGFHEIFHALVCAGATLQYVAIACLIT